ncbi:MAG: hypothetical protein J6O71_02510 [Lachnospiraceae bacterium]|nr:hypothetical protein [Lachnospiraceae bacterium]
MNRRLLFLYGFLMGALMFIAVYGVKVINPLYDAWIFATSDPDIKQHYLGWCHFRTSPWHFPIGLIDSLSYPYPQSCLWTDSIPLFAVIFKLFRGILPPIFQYLGLYGLISMALMGGFSALLVQRVTRGHNGENILPFIGVFPFILSTPILQRMFYHTSLSAHFFIIAALLIMLDKPHEYTTARLYIRWSLLSLLVILIHPYLWAMTTIIEAFSLTGEGLIAKKWKRPLICFALTIFTALAGLFLEGAFYGNVPTSYSMGDYEANLLTFINPMGYSSFLPAMELASGTQYEGFAYFGLGMLILSLIAAIIAVFKLIRSKKLISEYIETHMNQLLLVIAALCFFAYAALPHISLGKYTLLHLSFPKPVEAITGIFRSTGRFIWVVVYIIFAGVFYLLSKYVDSRRLIPLLLICLLLQAADLSDIIRDKHSFFSESHEEHVSDFDDPVFLAVVDRYDRFIFSYDNVIRIMDAAYYAYKHGMTLNRFYYARDNHEQVETALNDYLEKAASGRPEADLIYMFDENNLPDYIHLPLHFYYLHGSIFGVVEPIDGLEEFCLEDLK